ncbi:MAG: Eco57I restriction-modification methylase domain-containing protein, partial [Akkermansiaceae bacterium]
MSIESAIQNFADPGKTLLQSARSLFKDALSIPLQPLADTAIEPKRFFKDQHKEAKHSGIKHLYLVGRVDDRCFQPAHAPEGSTLDLDAAIASAAKDYDGMFVIAVEMADGEFTRSDLASRTREINRVFTNPVIILFRHSLQKEKALSIGVISRRDHKRDQGTHVLGKVSMIRDIRLTAPHRGHIEILKDFSLAELEKNHGKGKRGFKINNYKTFHAALEAIFDTELLNKRFYQELANWYFWALPQVEFPDDMEKDDEKRRATGLIRLLTRLIFCWFLKEKSLVPEKLFDQDTLAKLLKGFDSESETSSTYYQAILQNLFFATLNQRMGKDGKGNPYRAFAKDEGFAKNRATYDVNNLYRYEKLFAVPEDEALALFADIPFLNGGLFECLDRTEDVTDKKLYLDGFSRNSKNRPTVPDRLFFDSGATADLSTAYGDKKRKAEKVTGLISILNRYKFTIVENTPIDQEIALDPELLGQIFENLLASYNEETKTTARKQTGSFYTPRPIVDYMVDESLKAHFERKLTTEDTENTEAENQNSLSVPSVQSVVRNSSLSDLSFSVPSVSSVVKNSSSSVVRSKLDDLVAYTEREHAFTHAEVATLIAAIDSLKVLDPACGSGAFPMGVLHKLVYILSKLDPDNVEWEKLQIAKVQEITDTEERRRKLAEIVSNFADNNDDYGRKLYLIENCLYGVDVQPIAIQITKLRFFISLVCDQTTNRNKKDNHGIRPLPNLETKFVAADTLIGLPELEQMSLAPKRVYEIEGEIEALYHHHFSEQRRDRKLANQRKIKSLRQELGQVLSESLMAPKKAQHVAEWDPFDPQSSADFFDPHWMFGRTLKDGFDIIIGNPPYISVERFAGTPIQAKWQEQFTTYAARGDVYCFFYERGASLLRNGGNLTFITSNKWMRAGYGERLRGFLATKVNTAAVLDFGMAQNFGAATTYTCITRFVSEKPDGTVMSCYATDDRAAINDPGTYFAENAVPQKNLGENAWVVLSGERQRIKDLVEAQGVPLGKWDIQISRGIITGFNEAFYLTAEQREALIAEDPNSEQLIGRLLRGRDVERYKVNWSELYQLIIKFGSYERLEIDYPAVFKHLKQFERQLKARGQCSYARERKVGGKSKPFPGQHHWLELDNNPGDD